MTDRPRIILHVGAPKTGSTYLQQRFRAATELLRKNGIYIPVLPAVARMAGNAKLLAVAIDKSPSLSFQRAFPELNVCRLEPEVIAAELLSDWRKNSEILFLSGENFRSFHAKALRNILPSDASYTVVLFIRRQDDWVDSYFNQLTKTRDIFEDMSSFVAQVCNSRDDRICCPDWFAQYKAWRDAFGGCEVIFYDEIRSDLFGGFLAATGLNPIPCVPEISPTQLSLGIYQLAYLLQQDRHISLPDFVQRRMASQKASQQLGWNTTQSLLSPLDRQRLRDRFEPTNDLLLAELGYAGRPEILQIETKSANYCDLNLLYRTADYAQYQKLANAICIDND